jgi:hypothetical protein
LDEEGGSEKKKKAQTQIESPDVSSVTVVSTVPTPHEFHLFMYACVCVLDILFGVVAVGGLARNA